MLRQRDEPKHKGSLKFKECKKSRKLLELPPNRKLRDRHRLKENDSVKRKPEL